MPTRKRLPYRAFIGREGHREEIDAAAARIADGAEYLSWAGERGTEVGRTVLGFDTPEKAQVMQVWMDASGIVGVVE